MGFTSHLLQWKGYSIMWHRALVAHGVCSMLVTAAALAGCAGDDGGGSVNTSAAGRAESATGGTRAASGSGGHGNTAGTSSTSDAGAGATNLGAGAASAGAVGEGGSRIGSGAAESLAGATGGGLAAGAGGTVAGVGGTSPAMGGGESGSSTGSSSGASGAEGTLTGATGGGPAVGAGGTVAGVGGTGAAMGGDGNLSTGVGGGTVGSDDVQVVGYFAQWGIYARNYRVKDVDTSGAASRLTVINYAFGNVVDGKCHMETQLGIGDAWADYQKGFTADESVSGVADAWDQPLKGNFNQLKALKAKYPALRVLISLGGWTWSQGFSDAALTEASRQMLVASCIDMYIHGNLPVIGGEPAGGDGAAAGVFDGIDIDWEYPAAAGNDGTVFRPEDTTNFTALLAEFRRQLDAIDPTLLLTIAAPAGQDKIEKIEASKIHTSLDWLNLMTYDLHGAWDATGPTNFHAPLYASDQDPSTGIAKSYSTDAAVQAYLAAGVPASKLTVGIPFYGRGWTGVPDVNDGLYQSNAQISPAPGTYEAGIEDYKVLSLLGYPGFRDSVTQAYWIYNGSTFWSYDDPTSIAAKMAYAQTMGLRGAMVWELDGDTADGALLGAVVSALGR